MRDGFDCDQVPGWNGNCCDVCHRKNLAHVFRIIGEAHRYRICCKFSILFVRNNQDKHVEMDDSEMDEVAVSA